MTRFKYYSNYLACLLGTLIAFELCWIGAKYVIEEKDRVLAVCDALQKGDYVALKDFDEEHSFAIGFGLILRFKNYKKLQTKSQKVQH